jgi:hypothetical protein
MPTTEFNSLPDSSRVWVYGADKPLDESSTKVLLEETDNFLSQWKAHGTDLLSARDWSEDRFLTIAVDQEREGASGCSIDVLFRTLKSLESRLGAKLVTSGLVYFRGRDGGIRAVTRDEFGELAAGGEIEGKTEVFDLTVTTLGEWRGRFRSKVEDSWHAALIPEKVKT